jgi:D-alanine--poly(phosphoribitol) ligase subunit 2
MSAAHVLRQQISQLFAGALNRPVPSVDLDLFEAGVLDSVTFVELLLHLELDFGVRASAADLDLDRFRSITCIADFVGERADSLSVLRNAATTGIH